MRVYEVAKKHKISSKELIEICRELEIKDKKSVSSLSEKEEKKVSDYFSQGKKEVVKKKDKPKKEKEVVKKKAQPKKEKKEKKVKKTEHLESRAPVVTIMGHVDHGKTTILDAIRKSRLVQKEHGQITQKIGAYRVNLPEQSIVFLDTPGHEAFTEMRARGTQITDIVVLVVAADEGVKPQTIEAINHAKSAKVPIIVAINKIDKPNVNPEKIKQQLSDYGLVPEEWSGDTVFVNVSGLTGEGLEHLLEMITLVGEMLELKVAPSEKAEGIVIESQIHRSMGPIITVLIQKGTLKIGEAFTAGDAYGKIRALIDDRGNRIKEAGPSTPVEILGSKNTALPGTTFRVLDSEKQAKEISEQIKNTKKTQSVTVPKLTLEDLYAEVQKGVVKELKLILKADCTGSIEVVKKVLERISMEEVSISILHSGTGTINESDILLASASNGIVIGFNVSCDSKTEEVAKKEKVEVKIYHVIYELTDEIKKAVEGMLEPVEQQILSGQAVVKKVFALSKNLVVAGCLVVEGKILRNSTIKVIRDGKEIFKGRISGLKKFKEPAKEVLLNAECGIEIENFKNFEEGDIIQSYITVKTPRKL